MNSVTGANPPLRNWTPQEIYTAICRDFETARNAVARTPTPAEEGRGNFLFAQQAMILSEFACRLCAGHPTGGALARFSEALSAARPGYFRRVPIAAKQQISKDGILLPPSPHPISLGSAPLLWPLFDLIRNGIAHQYQQTLADLADGQLHISLGGPDVNLTLPTIREHQLGTARHLTSESSPGAFGILVEPAWLYLDFRAAVDQSAILSTVEKGNGLSRLYEGVTVDALKRAFNTDARDRVVVNSSPSLNTVAETWTPPIRRRKLLP